jgi:hypothetical protein
VRTFASARLDNEDILSSHALFDLYPRLAALELIEQHLCRGYAQVVADSPAYRLAAAAHRNPHRDLLSELRMRAPAEDDNVAHHGGSGGVIALRSSLRGGRVKERGAECAKRRSN